MDVDDAKILFSPENQLMLQLKVSNEQLVAKVVVV
jgi:hypothetical protein